LTDKTRNWPYYSVIGKVRREMSICTFKRTSLWSISESCLATSKTFSKLALQDIADLTEYITKLPWRKCRI